MQKVHRQQILEHKLKSAVGEDVKHNNHLSGDRGHLSGEEPHDHNRDHRDVVEARENTNDLPESLSSELQQRRDQ